MPEYDLKALALPKLSGAGLRACAGALANPITRPFADSQEALRDLGVGRYTAEQFFFTHYRALLANGQQADAEDYLRRSYERVLQVAEQTDDAELRRSWLEDVRVNREVIAEWQRLHQTG